MWYLNALPIEDGSRLAVAADLVAELRRVDTAAVFANVTDSILVSTLISTTSKPQFKLSNNNDPVLNALFKKEAAPAIGIIVTDSRIKVKKIIIIFIKKMEIKKIHLFFYRMCTTPRRRSSSRWPRRGRRRRKSTKRPVP
jgi:hypothetical protein